jgi:type 1 fimbria pilin
MTISFVFNSTRCRGEARLAFGVKALLAIAFTLLCLISTSAFAGSCTYTDTTPTYIQGNPVLNGSITVGRDVKVGAELYTATYWGNNPWNIRCDAGVYTYQKNYKTVPPYGIAPIAAPKDGIGKVYNTSIPGIGVYIWSNGPSFPISEALNYPVVTFPNWGSGGINAMLSFDVSIIKTADVVGAGTLRGSDFPTVEFSFNGSTKLVTLVGQIIGSLNVVSRTCITPDVSVDLGTHNIDELKGVGTTTSWINVPIQLNDCPAFFGYNSSRSTNGSMTYGSLGQNGIRYNVAPVTSVVVPNQGVMALQSDGVNPTATGIGIQIANASGTPVTYNADADSGLKLSQVDGASYTIPLQARYYQTTATPTAGQANGAATVTLIYN